MGQHLQGGGQWRVGMRGKAVEVGLGVVVRAARITENVVSPSGLTRRRQWRDGNRLMKGRLLGVGKQSRAAGLAAF